MRSGTLPARFYLYRFQRLSLRRLPGEKYRYCCGELRAVVGMTPGNSEAPHYQELFYSHPETTDSQSGCELLVQ